MAVGTISALILYDDNDADSRSTAGRLQTYLDRQGMRFNALDYAHASQLSTNLPQYLILVYSTHTQRNLQLEAIVDNMLAQVVERRVRSIVIVTTGSTGSLSQPIILPQKWASIPTYDARSYRGSDEYELEKRVWSETQYVKLPYSRHEATRVSARHPQNPARGRRSMPVFFMPAMIVIVFLLIVAAVWTMAFKVFAPPSARTFTSTAVVKPGNTGSTATAKTAQPDPEQRARERDLAAITKANPAVSGFQAANGWSTSGSAADAACVKSNTNYIVSIKQAGQYQPCLATSLSYKNFALQTTIDVKGDAGGIIFRSNNATYYRLAVNQIYTSSIDTPNFSLFLCSNRACQGNGVSSGTQQEYFSAKVGKNPTKVTVIAMDKNIDIYGNGVFLKRFTETSATAAGQVGVYAADLSHDTTVTFSDLKIWSLDGR